MKTTLASFAILAIMTAATPALAQPVSIDYRDLDLTSAEGQSVLDQRIDRAARETCGIDTGTTGSRIASRATRQCYKNFKQQAAEKIAAVVKSERSGG